MLNSKKQLTQVSLNRMQDKYRTDGSGGRNVQCWYACGDVAHTTRTCLNKQKVLALWKGKRAAVNIDTEKRENEQDERH